MLINSVDLQIIRIRSPFANQFNRFADPLFLAELDPRVDLSGICIPLPWTLPCPHYNERL